MSKSGSTLDTSAYRHSMQRIVSWPEQSPKMNRSMSNRSVASEPTGAHSTSGLSTPSTPSPAIQENGKSYTLLYICFIYMTFVLTLKSATGLEVPIASMAAALTGTGFQTGQHGSCFQESSLLLDTYR